jgi:hypothetical protein
MENDNKQTCVILRHDALTAPLVKSGACRQAIRKDCAVKAGDMLWHADSKGKVFRTDVCTATHHVIFVDKSDWVLDGERISLNTRHALARDNGFKNAFELAAFIGRTYRFHFVGTVIKW